MANENQNSATSLETEDNKSTSSTENEVPTEFCRDLRKRPPYQGAKISIKAEERRENRQMRKLRGAKHAYKKLADVVKEAMEELQWAEV